MPRPQEASKRPGLASAEWLRRERHARDVVDRASVDRRRAPRAQRAKSASIARPIAPDAPPLTGRVARHAQPPDDGVSIGGSAPSASASPALPPAASVAESLAASVAASLAASPTSAAASTPDAPTPLAHA
jgi:hypothetical protein